MTPRRALAEGAAACLVGLVVVAGCAGEQTTPNDDPGVHTHAGDDPGATSGPGHAMAGMPEISEPPDSADWNADDATYLTMMIAHHSQAIDLAELADEKAVDPRVRSLAAGIDAGQGREILVMAAWLVEHDVAEPTLDDVAAMTETGMPGMLSLEQVDDLAETGGSSFDRRFLEDMIQHHQGAVGMAQDLLGKGEDVRVVEMATEVVAGQSAEIARMRDLLEELP